MVDLNPLLEASDGLLSSPWPTPSDMAYCQCHVCERYFNEATCSGGAFSEDHLTYCCLDCLPAHEEPNVPAE